MLAVLAWLVLGMPLKRRPPDQEKISLLRLWIFVLTHRLVLYAVC